MTAIAMISALIMTVGIIGIVVPVLPGLLLVWTGVFLWAINETSTLGWSVLGAVTVMAGAGVLLQFLIPGQRMRRAGVATSTLIVGVVVAIVLGILIPVVGAFLGFPLGIYAVQRVRKHDHRKAWESTVHALKAVGLNIMIELCTALVIIATWVAALIWWK